MRTQKIEMRVREEEKRLIQEMAESQDMTVTRFLKLAIYHWANDNLPPDDVKLLAEIFMS